MPFTIAYRDRLLMYRIRLTLLVCAAFSLSASAQAADSAFLSETMARNLGLTVQWSGVWPVPTTDGKPVASRYRIQQSAMRSLVDLVVDDRIIQTTPLGMIGGGSSRLAKLEDGLLAIYAKGDLTLRELQNSAVGDPLGTQPNPQAVLAVKELVKDVYGEELDAQATLEMQKGIERFKSQFAKLELDLLKLKRRGKQGKIVPVKIPETRLYSLGYNGNLVSMDAETGNMLWSVQAGNPNNRPLGMDANDDHVVVVAGPRMFVFSASDGKEVGMTWIEGAARYGPLLSGDHAYIWTTGGGVEGYNIKNLLDPPFREIASGGLIWDPIRTPDGTRMSWPTSSGFLYVLETSGTPSLPFRLQPPDPIMTGAAAAPKNRIVAVSQTGTVYCVDALGSGKMLWRKLIGETVYDPPFVANDLVFVQSLERELFALDVNTGKLAWEAPIDGIAQVIAGDGANRVFAIGSTKELIVIDSKLGKVAAHLPLRGDSFGMPQNITDRVFLEGAQGQIQCLRPANESRPKAIFDLAARAPDKEAEEKSAADAPAAPANPFGAEPAAEPAMDAAPAADPFGGGADPFGAAADPFGAGMAPSDNGNPFGAN